MRGVFQAAMAKMTDKAASVEIQVADAAEAKIVARYDVSRSPMPLVLAIAPNGAVTKGLPTRFDEKQLRASVCQPLHGRVHERPSRQQARASVRPETARRRAKRWRCPRTCKTSPPTRNMPKTTKVVVMNLGDAAEAAFLKDLQVDPQIDDPGDGADGPAGRRHRQLRRRGHQGRIGRQAQGSAIGWLRPRLHCSRRARAVPICAKPWAVPANADSLSGIPNLEEAGTMRLRTLVLREIFERKSQLLTSFLAILLGITVIVSIKNISHYSEGAVAQELDSLGANVLVLPKSATLQDYYNTDLQSDTIPEEYVDQLAMSDIAGLDNISPKLSVPVQLQGKNFHLTGILPKKEFQAKAAWAGPGAFSRPIGCGKSVGMMGSDDKKTLSRKKVIETLEDNEVLVGADVAATLGLKDADSLEVLGKKFTVTAVLPQTGTVDDSRIFAHLHAVQDLAKKGHVVNVIEIIGCCHEISAGLVDKVNRLLPDAKVVTVAQTVQSQQRINGMMSNLSLMFLVIIVFVGGSSIANYMYANVFERRREIGTLMALGADSRLVLKVFLLKALLLGVAGGIGGYVLGSIFAFVLGPQLAGIRVWPMWELSIAAIGISIGLTLVASYFPARRAARLDPCATFQEV